MDLQLETQGALKLGCIIMWLLMVFAAGYGKVVHGVLGNPFRYTHLHVVHQYFILISWCSKVDWRVKG